MSSPANPSALRQLADLISSSVDAIEARFAKDGLAYPSLNDSFNPRSPAEALAKSPELVKHILAAVSACSQLSANIHMPMSTLADMVLGVHLPATLRTVVAINVVEVLREHPEGLHAKDIAAKTQSGIDPAKLARLLRALSTQYIFTETAPDTFKNNRLSSLIDTGKSTAEILADPDNKHTGTLGLSALVEHCGDEMGKGAAYLTETLLDPKTRNSDAPEHNSIARAFGFNKSVWEWYEEPGNEHRLKRFALVAGGFARTNPGAILAGFKWQDLAPGAVVVDVGGGQGHNMLTIREKYPQFKFIVQDRAGVMEEAKKFWNSSAPGAIESNDVTLQAQDFFEPQANAIAPPDVYLLSMILHDYGRGPALRILKHLRDAASPQTRLIIVDQVVPYACPSDTIGDLPRAIPGADQIQPQVPPPLLPNLGKANSFTYLGDLTMLVGLNGEARTLTAYIELLEASGWKIKEMFPILGALQTQIVARPI
ncbi:hypothetical protein V5O48_003138 [Marasmius crinis-equi]|uniref:O-methyltransferase domain-containing protein n=1 Tax=Marasmius crinis-equi TaxID=585013 RepID=A0ABR3FTM8_9AGAR